MNKIVSKEYPPVRDMSKNQRIEIVKDIFSSVTNKYDFLNRFLSLRQDLSWRKKTVEQMHFFDSYKLLDMAKEAIKKAIKLDPNDKNKEIQNLLK